MPNPIIISVAAIVGTILALHFACLLFDFVVKLTKRNKMGYIPPPQPKKFSPRPPSPKGHQVHLTNKQLLSILRENNRLTLKVAEALGLLGDMDPVEIVELKQKEAQDNITEKI